MINKLEPREVFSVFSAITQVPRPSKKEGKISDWLVCFAHEHGIEVIQDKSLNVIMRVGATSGYENKEGIILQAHMDMVCEKESSCSHDFEKDPIDTYIDGDYIRARGTTLGGDDGIGIAIALAVLTSKTLPHPALEALFTVDEETGLTGANLLEAGYLHHRQLINLDSEDDGQIFVGCAGGVDSVGRMYYKMEDLSDTSWYVATIHLSGLVGGHSGDDIDKGRANANKLVVRFLSQLRKRMPVKVFRLNGGNLRNAIAREAEVGLLVPFAEKENLRIVLNEYIAVLEAEYGAIEPDMRWDMQTSEMPTQVLPDIVLEKLLNVLYACPHGVIAMSRDIAGLVETSTNLASVKMKENERGTYFEICTSQRSSVESRKEEVKDMVTSALLLVCDEVVHSDGYPGWKPNMDSPLLAKAQKAYKDLFGKDPVVKAIHAGLECGLFLEKYPYLDMISIGPQMYFVHSPQEKLSISSTERCWRWLCRILEN